MKGSYKINIITRMLGHRITIPISDRIMVNHHPQFLPIPSPYASKKLPNMEAGMGRLLITKSEKGSLEEPKNRKNNITLPVRSSYPTNIEIPRGLSSS